MASDIAGLKIIDVSEPYNPLPAGNISKEGQARGVSTIKIEAKIYALVACNFASLKIIDVSDPYNPLPVGIGNIITGGDVKGVSSIKIEAKIYALAASR